MNLRQFVLRFHKAVIQNWAELGSNTTCTLELMICAACVMEEREKPP